MITFHNIVLSLRITCTICTNLFCVYVLDDDDVWLKSINKVGKPLIFPVLIFGW
jgi:hypothetical protein